VEPPVHIGICTGNVYIGIVGNEGSRKEAIILGEPVEKALLLMQTATKHYGKIYVDIETRKEASHAIEFEFKEHLELSHKLVNDPIFEPVDYR
jgi:class 3 adenylate cyclase